MTLDTFSTSVCIVIPMREGVVAHHNPAGLPISYIPNPIRHLVFGEIRAKTGHILDIINIIFTEFI